MDCLGYPQRRSENHVCLTLQPLMHELEYTCVLILHSPGCLYRAQPRSPGNPCNQRPSGGDRHSKPVSTSLLHRLAENLWPDSPSNAGSQPPLFPLLDTLVIHVRERVSKWETFIPESTALINLVLARKQSSVTASLQEIVSSQSAEHWAVWDTLGHEVPVTFF